MGLGLLHSKKDKTIISCRIHIMAISLTAVSSVESLAELDIPVLHYSEGYCVQDRTFGKTTMYSFSPFSE